MHDLRVLAATLFSGLAGRSRARVPPLLSLLA
jgi:hypothetical protein